MTTPRQCREHPQRIRFVNWFAKYLAVQDHGRIGAQDHGSGPGIHGRRLFYSEANDHDICGFTGVLSFVDVDARGSELQAHVLENPPTPGGR